MKIFLRRDANPRSGPHIGNGEIFRAIIFKIEPGNAHSRAYIRDACFVCDIGKGAVAVVAIKILASEIVRDIKVWPRMIAGVAPAATETEAIVVLVQPGLLRHIAKSSITIIAQQKVWRTVSGVIVRHWIAILVGALVISV